ncbi:MAG: hypothetical protein ACKVQU_00220, partial [Burkholderiales bacterium]
PTSSGMRCASDDTLRTRRERMSFRRGFYLWARVHSSGAEGAHKHRVDGRIVPGIVDLDGLELVDALIEMDAVVDLIEVVFGLKEIHERGSGGDCANEGPKSTEDPGSTACAPDRQHRLAIECTICREVIESNYGHVASPGIRSAAEPL